MGITVLTAIISLLLGGLLGFVLSKNISGKKTTALNEQLTALKVENASLQNNSNILTKLQEEFKNIANQALIDNQNQLQKQNSIALEDKLKPLNYALERYQKGVEEFDKESIKRSADLKGQVENLMKNSMTLQEETHRLTRALTLSQNTKGQFGEDTLEVILNSCGMSENVHYSKQFSTVSQNNDGEQIRIRPDFVVNLPNNKHIVIDSKMNLEQFIKYQNEEDGGEKDRYLKEFKSDVKNTIKRLSEKNYQNGRNLNSPDFVFAYIPLENSISILYDDIDIVDFALSKNIILIGTVSLVATLRLVQNLLAQEKQREYVIEIANTGAALYEKFADFCENLQNIQKRFKGVDDEFKTTLNRFTRGDDSLFKNTEKLKELGVLTTKQIPEEFLVECEV